MWPKRLLNGIPLSLIIILASSFPRIAHAETLEAYAWPPSVEEGGTVTLYVSTDAQYFSAKVYRQGVEPALIASLDSIPGQLQAIPDSVWAVGCGWQPSIQLPIPEDWPSGVYVVDLNAHYCPEARAIFTVRSNHPGVAARILFVNSIATWQAYNAWGGKSLYDFNSTGLQRSSRVSYQRPYDRPDCQGDFPQWETYLVRWLEEHGYAADYATSLDLDADPGLLAHYRLVLSVGHDEYWSRPMRDHMQDYIDHGGCVAFLGANTCWWQVRFSEAHDQITCYKDKCQDPMNGVRNELVTVNWQDAPIVQPENTLTGVSFRNGGIAGFGTWFPQGSGFGGYTVYHTDHWLFAGTGLADGDVLGQAADLVASETDGALFFWQHGLPVVTGNHGTPLNYTILGVAPASEGWATMGFYTAPSTAFVFNAACTDWVKALDVDPQVSRITANLIDALVPTGDPRTDAPRIAAALPVTVTPNPASASFAISWAPRAGHAAPATVYDVRGALVARVNPAAGPGGQVSATWDGRDIAGRAMAAGCYFVVVETASGVRARKLLLAR